MVEGIDPQLLKQYQALLEQQRRQEAGQRFANTMAAVLGTSEAQGMARGLAASRQARASQTTGLPKEVIDLLKSSIELSGSLPQETYEILGKVDPLNVAALQAYQTAFSRSPQGRQLSYYTALQDLREDDAMLQYMHAAKAMGLPVPGLETLAGEPPSRSAPTREELLERATIGQEGMRATEEQSSLTPTAMGLVVTPQVMQAGTARMQELRQAGAVAAPEYEIREDTVRLPDGSEQKRFYWLDKKGQAPPLSIVGDMSAPAMNDIQKTYAAFNAAVARKDYDAAQVYLKALEKSTESEGFILTQTPDGMTIAKGPATDQVLNRRYNEQKQALDTFEDTITMLDNLQRTAADFGPGAFLQGITQGIRAGGGAFAAAVSRLVEGKGDITILDDKGKNVTSKWFNPKLGQAELLTHTLALVRAGIYGQSGRSLSDRDMENFAKGIKAGSLQEWQAIRETLLTELSTRRTRLDQYIRDIHPTQRSPLYFLYEKIPGAAQAPTSAPAAQPQRSAARLAIDARIDQAVANANRLQPSQWPVNTGLIQAVVEVESSYNPNAVSPKGAQGLMQLMPGTARALKVTNPFDIDQNLAGGITYLQSLIDQYQGDLDKALAAYNAGPDAVQKYGGVPPYPETIAYIDRIRARLGLPPRVTNAPKAPRPALDKALDFSTATPQTPETPIGPGPGFQPPWIIRQLQRPFQR